MNHERTLVFPVVGLLGNLAKRHQHSFIGEEEDRFCYFFLKNIVKDQNILKFMTKSLIVFSQVQMADRGIVWKGHLLLEVMKIPAANLVEFFGRVMCCNPPIEQSNQW